MTYKSTMSSTNYNSPSRSPSRATATTTTATTTTTTAASTTAAAARMHQLGPVSRLRSSSLKKPPEPLRRAVADSLSSSSSSSSFSSISALSSHHPSSSPSVHASEATRTLRDYLAAPSTTDLAYCVILEHTLAERDRSPAVVARCVALLKRYLLRYKPSEETLVQIDKFCVHIMTECDIGLSRKLLPWSHPLNQQSSAAKVPVNGAALPVSSFASASLNKSLKYVRSLVAQHTPRRSFQPAAFAGASSAPRQILPSLSSLLSRSFNSQLNPANAGESPRGIDTTLSVPSDRKNESSDVIEDLEYITSDVLKWRWRSDQESNLIDSDQTLNTQDLTRSNLLVGAAALLVSDWDTKKGQSWRHFGTADMPYLDQLLQPSSMSSVTNCASARHHLRIITASKRVKSGSQQIWEDCSVSTFRPRARPLFQYRHYSEQQPLKLNPTEVGEVISAVCSETSMPNANANANANLMTISTGLSSHRAKPSIDVAVSVLIKLVIDMYLLDSESAAPLTLSMLEDMVCSPRLSSKTRAFDLILNLAVHAHLLEPVVPDDVSTIEEDYPQESSLEIEAQVGIQRKKTDSHKTTGDSSAIDNFESWILNILCEILLLLVQIEEKQEYVWASALSCLLYFVCDGGRIRRSRLKGLDVRVVKALIEVSRMSSWAEIVHSKLISILASMFYDFPDEHGTTPRTPKFLAEQVDMIGGIDFIFMEYSLAKTREERRNLYSLLFDYVLHRITVLATGVPEYVIDEIQPLATLLSLANAPEAFHISVKLGVEDIGELLRRSVSAALSRFSDSEQLYTILEKVMSEFDSIVSSFTHLQKEFSDMRQQTRSFKYLKGIEDGIIGRTISSKAKLSWATLHSLLHSDRITCRQNGYIWLGDLLRAEISEERGGNLFSNISSLQEQIALVDLKDPSARPDIPLSISLMCGLLKSKDSTIRAGFLSVLEVLLMRCKFLLDENGLEDSASKGGEDHCLEKANSVIDIMSSCLSLVVAQINETDHFNILKMCDILFSQLCLKVPPASADSGNLGRGSSTMDINNKVNLGEFAPIQENIQRRGLEDVENFYSSLVCETSSMAALLLQGRVVVPLQLVARVPAGLLFWPLIQLAGAATDNIALGVSVGSEGRGNLPGATSDIRAALLLLLIAKCTADSAAFEEVDGEDFFRQLLDDTDARVAYYSSAFLLKRMMTADFDNYQRRLQQLVFRAQQSNNEKLLENPYLQMRGILQLTNDFGSGL